MEIRAIREYWEKRVEEQGLNAVSTVGNVDKRTQEEIEFLTGEIKKVCPEPVDLAIDFGAGWGRLLPVLTETSNHQVLVDFVEKNKNLYHDFHSVDGWEHREFIVCSIKDFQYLCKKEIADYALSSFVLLHIVDAEEFEKSVKSIINAVKEKGHLFVYESYNESGNVAKHCSSRNREQFLEPFKDCELLKEIDWKSQYQPHETNFRQPIKLFIFRRGI